MNTEDIKSAQQLLSEAQEKLNLLKNNADQLPVREVLVLASSIREKVCNNQILTSACDNDAAIAQLRKNLLEDIHAWQVELIEKIVSNISDDTILLGQITDFDKAKKAMVEMIEAEQAKHIFEETESPKLMDGIADCEKHTATICRVAENCKNGTFLALFLGDFQSGKSITIDALCDGRHICAIGDGMATSAVLVKVSYGKKESIHIDWRAKEQLLSIIECIKRVKLEYDWVSFDLDKKEERDKLADAIEQMRQRENKLVKGQTLEQDEVKLLMFCDLILTFYGTEKLQEKKALPFSISNISDFTRFPKDDEEKWRKKGVKGFTIDEAIFLFIDSVSCTIPSETLKKLNCTIIDSPGLFHSTYDTMVTESAMVAAHAIVYVLPYDKAAGKDVCKSLYTIKKKYKDVHNKLFIVNNVNSLKENAFVESNRAYIKAQFGSEKEVYVYDAKVSYLAQLKRLYDMGLATASDFAHLMHAKTKTPIGSENTLNFQTFDKAWEHHIKPYRAAYGTNEMTSMDTYLNESGFLNMVSALKAFIEKNEAHAVILSNALIPMHSELMAIKRELCTRYIEPYTTSHEKLVADWNTRIDNIRKFEHKVKHIVHLALFEPQNGKSLCDRISYEEYNKIFSSDFYKQMAIEIAYVLYDNKGELLVTKTLFKKDKELFKKRFGDIVFPLIGEKLTSMITNKMRYVLELIESGQDSIIENMFAPVASNIKLKLKNEWSSLFKDDEKDYKLDDYLTVPDNLKGYVVEKKEQAPGTDIMSSTTISLTLLGGLVLQITAVVAGVAAMIAGYIGAILCDPMGISQTVSLILFALLGIGGLIIESFAPDWLRDKFANALQDMVLPKLKEQGATGFRDIVNLQIEAILTRYANDRKVDIQKMQNARDVALASNPNQEEHCFRALEIIDKIAEQVSEYETYKETYVKNETY